MKLLPQAQLARPLRPPPAGLDGVRAVLRPDGVPAAAVRALPLVSRRGSRIPQDALRLHVQEGGVPRRGQGAPLRRLQESAGQVSDTVNQFCTVKS